MSKLPLPVEYQGYRTVSAAEMKEIDERCEKEFGLSTLTLMENAGKAVARETLRTLQEGMKLSPEQAIVVIGCGRGHNGGDGLVAARVLKEKQVQTEVFLAPPKRELGYSPAVQVNLDKAKAAGIPVQILGEDFEVFLQACKKAHLLLDALLGTGSSGKPAGPAHKMIQKMMASKKPILAIDLPSGIHPDTGYHSGAFIQAVRTLTLGLPKKGLLAPHAQRYVGELLVLDIGFPPQLIQCER